MSPKFFPLATGLLVAVAILFGAYFGRRESKTITVPSSEAKSHGDALVPVGGREAKQQIASEVGQSPSIPARPALERRSDLEYIKSLQTANVSVSVRLLNSDKTLSTQLQRYLDLTDQELIGLQDALRNAKQEVGRIAAQNLVVMESDSRVISVKIPAASEAERAALFGFTIDALDASIGPEKTDLLIAAGFEELFSHMNQFWAYETPYRIQSGGVSSTESYPFLLAAPIIGANGGIAGGNVIPFSVRGDLESERRLAQYPWIKKIWGEINNLTGK